MMLSRLRAPAVSLGGGVQMQTRAYSYFSQRPGRFFTSSKPAASAASYKRAAKIGGARGTSEPYSDAVDAASGVGSADTASGAAASGVRAVDASDAHASVPASAEQQQATDPQQLNSLPSSSTSTTRMSSIPPTAPLFHPQPPLPSLHLHEFFAQHRPLLLLDQPVANLFSPLQPFPSSLTSSSRSELPISPNSSASLTNAQAQIEDEAAQRSLSRLDFDTSSPSHGVLSGEADADADADVARVLARSLVVQRIQASRDWASVEKKLGLPSEAAEVQAEQATEFVIEMDSVKRKRRKKMNKHKYKKRRKVQRAERRRLGK